MSRSRKTLWKTSKSNARPLVAQIPMDVWTFRGFADPDGGYLEYRQLSSGGPLVGDTVPSWLGMVATSPVGAGAVYESFCGAFPFVLQLNHRPAPAPAYETISGSAAPGGSSFVETPVVEGVVAADVLLLTVQPSGGEYLTQFWLNGTLRSSFLGPVYVPAPTVFSMRPGEPSLGIASWAGGNAALSDSEIAAWFNATRVDGVAAEVSGKTLDLFSASYDPGNVPALLPNAGPGQAGTLFTFGAPTVVPENVLQSAVFSY